MSVALNLPFYLLVSLLPHLWMYNAFACPNIWYLKAYFRPYLGNHKPICPNKLINCARYCTLVESSVHLAYTQRYQMRLNGSHNHSLVQDCSNPSAFAMVLLQTCARPSIYLMHWMVTYSRCKCHAPISQQYKINLVLYWFGTIALFLKLALS